MSWKSFNVNVPIAGIRQVKKNRKEGRERRGVLHACGFFVH
jgi:hypothetical protein